MWGEDSVPMRHFCETNVFVILAYSLLASLLLLGLAKTYLFRRRLRHLSAPCVNARSFTQWQCAVGAGRPATAATCVSGLIGPCTARNALLCVMQCWPCSTVDRTNARVREWTLQASSAQRIIFSSDRAKRGCAAFIVCTSSGKHCKRHRRTIGKHWTTLKCIWKSSETLKHLETY